MQPSPPAFVVMRNVMLTPKRTEVPEDAFSGDEPLVAVMRGSYVGSLHRGMAAVVAPDGEVRFAVGRVDQPVFLRSSAKPFQVIPAVLAGGIEQFGLTGPEFAVLCASHHAEPRHREAILSVLEKIGLPESALSCGIHAPIDEESAREMIRQGRAPTPVCNNCSGAHTGMLVACRAMGWPIERYGDPAHPLQTMTREILGAFCDIAPDDVQFAVDNCAVPTFYIPLDRSAMAFARLATGREGRDDLAGAAQQIRTVMAAHPEMIGGEGSFDTDLMRVAKGTLVAKGGAEAYQGIGIMELGLGLAMKISDGVSEAIPPPVIEILSSIGALSPEQAETLSPYAHPQIRNWEGQLVGEMVTTLRMRAS
jgi:L-asparaginase II